MVLTMGKSSLFTINRFNGLSSSYPTFICRVAAISRNFTQILERAFLGTMKRKKLLIALIVVVLLCAAGWGWFTHVITIHPPVPASLEALKLERSEPSPGFYTIGNSWLQKNDVGLYEMYVEGEPFERGVIYGKLAKELLAKQEEFFVGQIKNFVPSEFYLQFLKYLIGWFNRDLDEAIPQENLLEIYGVSQSAPDGYEFIGGKYQRMLNYHAAHDIGHALQDKNMVVGCTSFGAWGNKTADSSMIIGRNFDFYVGDSFARDKIIMFMKPSDGIPFMMVTWGGMTGVVSGMNLEGLTVTLNAAKSEYPTGAATPISILAREILQYSSNIDEAFAIAKTRHTFVSESIFIGSANDGEAAIIEKTPTKTELYRTTGNNIVCSNHFQSDAFQTDEANMTHKVESSSNYRFERMNQLLGQNYPLTVGETSTILRDHYGMDGKKIGLGNEDAINQLLAHHSIIFMPEKRLVWISANPVPYNDYVAYDLNKIFTDYVGIKQPQHVDEVALRISADSLLTNGYGQYVTYKRLSKELIHLNKNGGLVWSDEELHDFIALNPDYYEAYELVGDNYSKQGNKTKAIELYKQALALDVPLADQRKGLTAKIQELEKAQ